MLNPGEERRESAVCNYLNEMCINYMVIDPLANHTLDEITTLVNVEKNALLRAVLVKAQDAIMMCILPNEYFFDIGAVTLALESNLHALNTEEQALLLSQFNIEICPPLPDFLGVSAIVERDILSLKEIYFRPSLNNALIGMKRDVYMAFVHSSNIVSLGFPNEHLSNKNSAIGGVSETIKQLTPIRIKQRLKDTIELPAMPTIAQKILKLRFNPQSTSKDLALAIEKDPSLSAQLMSWAKSPYYGYSGKINSVEDAIVKVLGFDLVMNLALGIILGRAMKVDIEGPLGLRAYWQFAILCAALVENIVKMISPLKRPVMGLAYLGGLLQNFGHLLLAQVFPPHFDLLTQYVNANPKTSIKQIESYVLGIGHDDIGAWMMQSWQLPPEVITAIRYHHDEHYSNEFAIYPNLVLIATRLLKRLGMGDADSETIPPELLLHLGLTELALDEALQHIMSQREDLFQMVGQVVPK